MTVDERQMWDGIRADYITGEMKVREIAQKWNVSESRIYKKATSEGWKKMQEKIRQKSDEIFVARAARVRAKEYETIATTAGKMSKLLEKMVDELDGQPAAQVAKQLKDVSALASAISTNVDTLAKVYGIQSPAQEAGQKIARQRLALDQRKQRFEEKNKGGGGGKRIVVEIEAPEGMVLDE